MESSHSRTSMELLGEGWSEQDTQSSSHSGLEPMLPKHGH